MIETNNLTKEDVSDRFLERIARIVLRGENKEKFDISIAIVSLNEIRGLNKKYRNKNKATDELSFKYSKESGEVVICSKKTKEIARSLIHGLLHLLGHDHEGSAKKSRKMFQKENHYFSLV